MIEPSEQTTSATDAPVSAPPAEPSGEVIADETPRSVVPPSPVARSGFVEWLLRRDTLRDRRAALESGASSARAVRFAKAALANGTLVASPPDPPAEGGSAHAALSLYIEALTWALATLPGAPASPNAAVALAGEHRAFLAALAGGEDELAEVARTVEQGFVERAERSEAAVALEGRRVRELALAVLRRAEAPRREIDAIRLARVARVGLLVAIVTALLFGAVKGIELATLPRDLAAGKPWKASSQYAGFSAAEHICDGVETRILFHTKEEESPWFEIDLGRSQTVQRLDVRNRADGLRDRAVPLVAEISENGRDWREVSRRSTTFDTWTTKFAPVSARYVRLRAQRRTFLHLEKISVRLDWTAARFRLSV